MNFWERVQWGVWKVQAFFGDEDAAIHADSLNEVVEGKTAVDREINTIVNSEKVEGPRIPIFSDLKDALEGALAGIGGVLKNLPYFLLVALVFIGIYLVLMGRKGAKVV